MTAFWEKMKEFKQAEIDLETRKMRRAPSAADKLTLIVENSNTYTTVHAGNTKSGALVTFAVADWPNVVGYYLCWRETWTSGNSFVRTKWTAHESHDEAVALAKRLAEQWRQTNERRRKATTA
jgi:hypothetical protein